MTFSYLGTLATDLERIRFEIGDTDSSRPLFSDEEINGKRAGSTDVLLAAADLCDVLATRFSREVDFSMEGQSVRNSQKAAAYRERARDLRARAVGVATAATTRVDAYSDDIDYQAIAVTLRVAHDDDLP